VPGVGPKTVEKISVAVTNYFSSLENPPADGAQPAAGEEAGVVAGAETTEAEAAAESSAATEEVQAEPAAETDESAEAAAAGASNETHVPENETSGSHEPGEQEK